MKNSNTKWYIRQQNTISGPFTRALLISNLQLGRITAQTEVSTDCLQWQPLGNIIDLQITDPDMPPPARYDERDGFDRRHQQSADSTNQEMRRHQRRKEEPAWLIQQRQQRTALRSKRYPQQVRSFRPLLLVSLLLIGAFVAALVFPPPDRPAKADCDSPPAAAINWENCLKPMLDIPSVNLTRANLRNSQLVMANIMNSNLTEADLSYADLQLSNLSYATLRSANLKGANLQQADLSYSDLRDGDLRFANLRGARLGSSNLQNARLDKAIWVDGKICAENSIGQCL